MRLGVGDSALAIASGVSPENVTEYMPYADVFIVATGISEQGSFYELSLRRLITLMTLLKTSEVDIDSRIGGLEEIPTQSSDFPYLHLMAPNTREETPEKFAWVDPSRMYTSPQAWKSLVIYLSAPFKAKCDNVDIVAGIDAAGFPLAGAMAIELKTGVLTFRKAGKLCVDCDVVTYGGTIYSDKSKEQSMELRKHAFRQGTRVLIVDQWIESGSTMGAAIELVERQGGVVAGIVAINIEDTPASRELKAKYKCHATGSVGRRFASSLLPLEATPDLVAGRLPVA